jgi:pimeloyl-ACP methyl ester carboxylesterase
MLHKHGYTVLLIDLRCHGESEGEYLSYGYNEALDVQAAIEYFVSDLGIPAANIALIGHSLGGATIVRAASLSQIPHVLVVVSTYRSLDAAIGDAFDDIALLPSWPFAPIMVRAAERQLGLDSAMMDLTRMLGEMTPRPVLLVHGAEDDLLPPDHHEALCQAVSWATCWLVPGMGHESPARFVPTAYEEHLIGFLDEALLGK